MAKHQYPDEIETIEDIQNLATIDFDQWLRYGDVNVTNKGDLLIFDYTTAAHIANRWNFFECVSRGLIINRVTGEVVARPFDKFFYWLYGGKKVNGHIVTVMEKVDGSLGILYRYKDEYHVTTKGSFFSKQGRWATKFLQENFDLTGLGDEWTLLCEIIYPENRIIIDYENREDLVLLAARNRFTGEYMPFFPDLYNLAETYGFTLPQIYQFNNVDEVIEATDGMDESIEGWVVEFSDGQRFKFKKDRYVELHKLIRSLTFKEILKAVATDKIDYILDTVPNYYLDEAKLWVEEIATTVAQIKSNAEAAMVNAPHDSEQFEAWAFNEHPTLADYLLEMQADRDLEPLIYRQAFREREAGNYEY